MVDRQALAEALKKNFALKRLNSAHTGIGVRGVEAMQRLRGGSLPTHWAGEIKLQFAHSSHSSHSSCLGHKLYSDGGSEATATVGYC